MIESTQLLERLPLLPKHRLPARKFEEKIPAININSQVFSHMSFPEHTIVVELTRGGDVSDTEYVAVDDVAAGETRAYETTGVYFADGCAIRQVLGPPPFGLPAKDLDTN